MIDQSGRPRAAGRDYDRAEIAVDGVVHAVGLVLGVTGAAVLIAFAARMPGTGDLPVSIVYVSALLAMLGFSAAYNLWPVSRIKWLLRRFDHAAIYLLIAATYTPFIAQTKLELSAVGLLLGVWFLTVVGIVLKLALPGRFDRLSIVLYLLLGWSGIIAYEPLATTLPPSALWLIAAGGIVYSTGIVFHLWDGLRFQNAIWHGFVLIAAVCHYTAVLDCVAHVRA